MSAETAIVIRELLDRVTSAHKFTVLSWVHVIGDNYHIVFDDPGVTYTTLVKWFADAGGEVTQVGYLPLDNEHYLVVGIPE